MGGGVGETPQNPGIAVLLRTNSAIGELGGAVCA